MANAFIIYFKARRLSGHIKDSIHHHGRDDEQCARQFEHLPNTTRQFEFTEVELARFFANAIVPHDPYFFFDNIKSNMTFPAIVALMEVEYDSAAHQATVQSKIKWLHLQTFITQNDITSNPTGL